MKYLFSKYEVFIVGVLAFLQFTVILDFMILSPLGAILMPQLRIDSTRFGLVVSAYAFSAGIAGFLTAGFADRFDRKKLLLFFYIGFVIGTLFCGIAPNYQMLLLARIATGLFGGVIGSIVMAITSDLFPLEVRGRVMGFVQTAFAASQVMGIPFSIFLANHWGWHFPFILIAFVGLIVGVFIGYFMRPIDEHLKGRINTENPFFHIMSTFKKPRHLLGFSTVMLLGMGGFMLMPFSSAFSVHNLGIDLKDLPTLYMATGVFSIFAGPLVGRASDYFGKFNIYFVGTVLAIIMVLVYTNLSSTPLASLIIVNALMFLGIFSRAIPAQALMSQIPDTKHRGAYMSISASIQQISGGFAAALAGLIVHGAPDGHIEHFNRLGYVLVLTSLISLFLIYQVHRNIPERRE